MKRLKRFYHKRYRYRRLGIKQWDGGSMAKVKLDRNSIVFKFTMLIIAIIAVQTLLLSGFLILGGVIDEAEQNAYMMFHDKVNNRKDYVQREMKNNWTNFDPYVASIVASISEENMVTDAFFEDNIPDLIQMLRTTQATGVFVVLTPEGIKDEALPALYLRDYDPLMNSYGVDDIYMVYGPSNLAKDAKLPLDQTWQYSLTLNEDNRDFVVKPFENAVISRQANLLGYWSKPFKLDGSDVSIITYSMPLFDQLGNLKGIIGIEITLNYLAKFFPAAELQPQDSLGYLIAYSDDEGEHLSPLVLSGALQKRMIDENQNIDVKIVDEDKRIYQISNHLGKEKLYASIEKVGLYQFNTPFEDEQWYIVGIMREDYLLNYAQRIKQILWISFGMSLAIGAVSGSFVSLRFTKPIVSLANQVRGSEKVKVLSLNRTGLQELDELSTAIEISNKLMLESASRLSRVVDTFRIPICAFELNHELKHVFVTDNFVKVMGIELEEGAEHITYEAFVLLLERLFIKLEPEEVDVYQVTDEPPRWLRYRKTENDVSTIGVLFDVTEAILEKREIIKDRDHDPLTQLLNRKGFHYLFDKWRQEAEAQVSALIMFDLDNLKRINDNYGHKWGDQYIIEAVARLKTIAEPDQFILGRRSGDEFVLLLHGFESKEAIIDTIETFFNKLHEKPLTFPDGKIYPVSLSGGIMWIESDELSYDELLHFADEALYVAKRNKKGSYQVSSWPH